MTVYNFNYTGNEESVFLYRGLYLIECWGASGGSLQGRGGKGAYVAGYLPIWSPVTLHVYVGQAGSVKTVGPTFNGGGSQSQVTQSSSNYAGSGGGASDVRIIGGNWDSDQGLQSRIIVAAGGGGASYYNSQFEAEGGDGGSIRGEDAGFSRCIYTLYNDQCTNPGKYSNSTGGGQTGGGIGGGSDSYAFGFPGSVGTGGNGASYQRWSQAGGGGGYYGGGGGGVANHCIGAGAGGSSYISGINTDESWVSKIYHFSSILSFKGGNEEIKLPNGTNEKGNTGNGYVRITFVRSITSVYHFSIYSTLQYLSHLLIVASITK